MGKWADDFSIGPPAIIQLVPAILTWHLFITR
jgi:hypothetical protein